MTGKIETLKMSENKCIHYFMLSVSYLVKEVHILLGDSVDFPKSSADGRCTVDIKVLAGFNPSVALLLQTFLVNVECLERLAQVLVYKVLRVFH